MTDRRRAREQIEAPLEQTAKVLAEPFRDFGNAQSSSGWLLLAMTLTAVVVSNSPWQQLYFDFIQTELSISLAGHSLRMSLQHWVADGLMAVFFFVLGLELKRELIVGQLSEVRRAVSVLCAALGGMLLPVVLFLLIAAAAPARDGWGIPVATDTAFALMVLVLLGPRIPVAARAFLVGLAIVDDLGAILVITFAYTTSLDTTLLAPTVLIAVVLVMLNLLGVRKALPYAIAGVALWLSFIELGLHGTLAGVVVALTAPVRPAISRGSFVDKIQGRLGEFRAEHDERTDTILEQPHQQALALDVLRASEMVTAPLPRWETYLQRPVSFLVMPAFVLMNAGVALSDAATWASDLSLGITFGLLLGKPLGIVLGVWIGGRLGLAQLPDELTWRHLVGVGLLGGIGFTMSLFIATLSFGEGTVLLETAKRSVIATSLIAGALGYAWLRWACQARLPSRRTRRRG